MGPQRQEAQEVHFRKRRYRFGVASPGRFRRLDQFGMLHGARNQQIAQVLRQSGHEFLQVVSGPDCIFDQLQHASHVARGNSVRYFEIPINVHHAQRLHEVAVRNIRAAQGDRLIEDRQRVPQGAVSLAGNEQQGSLVRANVFLFADGA